MKSSESALVQRLRPLYMFKHTFFDDPAAAVGYLFSFRLRQIPPLALLLLCTALTQSAVAQHERWRNLVYDDRIATVTFHRAGEPLVFPFAGTDAAHGTLILNFDVLGDEVRNYVYTLEHCNSDWSRSDLTEDEYIIGFREARIREAYPSVNTLVSYTLYSLSLPNEDMGWTKSGNYRLHVFDNTEENPVPVLVLRFLVLEPTNWLVKMRFTRPAEASKDNTHHEIDFEVDTKQSRLVSAHTDVKAYVLQNQRFDNAIGPLPPLYTRGNVQVFDYQGKVVFAAGKESRFFDIRTFDFRKQNVQRILRLNDYYEVALRADKDRTSGGYLSVTDANGGFIISNETLNQDFLESDYGKVLFRLEKPQEIEDADVYIVGAFNDYNILPKYRMDYSATEGVYFKELLLKQGYYNYEYAVVRRGETQPDPELAVEGNWYEARNLYHVLVYYRSINDRYDKLMCMGSFASGQ